LKHPNLLPPGSGPLEPVKNKIQSLHLNNARF
jgi:hypothetical protein